MSQLQLTDRVWNEGQRSVFADVESGEGHTNVAARAGTGKTTTIVEAFRYIPTGTEALMVAFNKSIANELEARMKGSSADVNVSTLHSYGNGAIFKSFGRMELDKNRVDGIIDELFGEKAVSFDRRRAITKTVSLAKSTLSHESSEIEELVEDFGIDDAGDTPEDRTRFAEQVRTVLNRCAKVEDGHIDFDDMVWLPVVLGLRTKQYDFVFCDEAQDLSAVQLELAMKAVKRDGRICVVGDDCQAIYGWRGADENAVANIIDRTKAKTILLSVTYRCARNIVKVANEIVPDLQAAPNAADGEVAQRSKGFMMSDARAGDFVISRTNAPLIPLCLGFIRDGKRANIQGRDVGQNLLALIRKAKTQNVSEMLDYVEEWKRKEMTRLIAKKKSTMSVEDRALTIEALAEGSRSVSDVVASIDSLFTDVSDQDRIMLSTTHRAKGLERDRVFLIAPTYAYYRNMNRDIETAVEEKNLWYVATTRAKNSLFFVESWK